MFVTKAQNELCASVLKSNGLFCRRRLGFSVEVVTQPRDPESGISGIANVARHRDRPGDHRLVSLRRRQHNIQAHQKNAVLTTTVRYGGCYGPFDRRVRRIENHRNSPFGSCTVARPCIQCGIFYPQSSRRRQTHSGDPYLLPHVPMNATWYSTPLVSRTTHRIGHIPYIQRVQYYSARPFQSTWIALQSFKFHQDQGVLQISRHNDLNES